MMKGYYAHTSGGVKLMIGLMMLTVGTVIASVLTYLILMANNHELEGAGMFRAIQLCSVLFMFIFPALATMWLINNNPLDALSLRGGVKPKEAVLTTLVVLCFIPIVSLLEELNKMIVLPEGLRWLENWMLDKELAAASAVDVIIAGSGVLDYLSGFVVVALLAALSEEIFFRGFIQNAIVRFSGRKHLAVWVVAFLFSAIHLQFYGFIPRMMLGALMGYLLLWSGSVWLPVIAHFINNAFYLALKLLSRDGVISYDIDSFHWSNYPMAVVVSFVACCALLIALKRCFDPQCPIETLALDEQEIDETSEGQQL